MKKIYYNKLVRDRIPEKITRNGGEYKIEKLGQKAFERELVLKVGEEAGGLLGAKDKEDFTSELADVLDVIEEIKQVWHISEREIRSAQKRAYETKGGFEKKLFLVWSSDTGYRTNERRYPKKRSV
jgi:predicted house-cleaning noncanonical NTP pyrophosphatase (MazG superfamily)